MSFFTRQDPRAGRDEVDGDRPGDAALVARCLAGDDDAWSDLLDRYSGLIYSVALKYGLRPDDAAEVFQNVCLEWWRGLDQLRETERLAGWLATLTGRTAWRWIEGQRRTRQREVPLPAELGEILPGRELPPEESALAVERSASLREAVERLDERCRRLMHLLFFSPDLPEYRAIAEEFGLAEGSIGALRQRCLTQLRRELDKVAI
ncbi:MAG TPA: sigma-70 family RNA polymerase sigma factor [Chloroflexota bacterium]|nr:sigma-70 family RNA polymerase sigma factor [Chloroflexota bacterium]